MVKEKSPVAVGVPVIAPVVVLRLRPVGSEPDAMANVGAGDPDAATASV